MKKINVFLFPTLLRTWYLLLVWLLKKYYAAHTFTKHEQPVNILKPIYGKKI